MDGSISYYFGQLTTLLASPWIIVFVLVGIIVVGLTLTVRSTRWWVLSLLLYSTTFGITAAMPGADPSTLNESGAVTLAFPLNLLQGNARVVSILCLAVLLLPALSEGRGRRISLFSAGFLGYFTLEVWIVMRLLMSGIATTRAILDVITFSLMLATLTIGLGRWLQGPDNVRSLMKSFFGFGVLFIVGNVYEIIRVPAMASQGRLSGTTPNAQLVGQAMAFVMIPILYLIQHRSTTRIMRVWYVATAGMIFLLLLWSGSRTSMLMVTAGVLCLFGWKQYKFIFPAIGLILVLWIGSFLLPQSVAGWDRFLDTGNDRAGAWSLMIEMFSANPLLGYPASGGGYGESFFLATLAFYGIIGALPVIAMVLATAFSLVGLFTNKRVVNEEPMLVNLLIASFVMMIIGAVFEASLLGSLNVATIIIYLDFALLAYARDAIREQNSVAANPWIDNSQGYAAYPYLDSDDVPDLMTH